MVLNTSGVDSDAIEHLVQGVSALALLALGAILKRLSFKGLSCVALENVQPLPTGS